MCTIEVKSLARASTHLYKVSIEGNQFASLAIEVGHGRPIIIIQNREVSK